MNKMFQELCLYNPGFRLVAILKSINKIFEKQLQRNPFLRGDSESISKIFEKHLKEISISESFENF